jgi:hypothetical protein
MACQGFSVGSRRRQPSRLTKLLPLDLTSEKVSVAMLDESPSVFIVHPMEM